MVQKIPVTIEQDLLETRKGHEIEGYSAECTTCGHTVESYGVNERSKRRCLVRMRRECPMGEENFYVED